MIINVKKILTGLITFLSVLIIISALLLVFNKNSLLFLQTIFTAFFSDQGDNIINSMFLKVTPIIFTALSLTIAFKGGMFNIGAEGQFIMGLVSSLWLGSFTGIPPFIHFVIIIFTAFLSGFIWGSISGILKALFKVHEVVSCIMLNFISLYLTKCFLLPLIADPACNFQQTKNINNTAKLTDIIPDISIINIDLYILIYFLIAILFSIIIKFFLDKTIFGYTMKSCGSNIICANYSGMNVKKNIIYTMALAGGLAGIAGAFFSFIPSRIFINLFDFLGYGFDGLTASLIGGGTVFGSILGALLLSYLSSISVCLQNMLDIPGYIIDMMTSLILYFIAIQSGFKIITEKILKSIKYDKYK